MLLKKLINFSLVLFCTGLSAATKVDVSFKGKTELHYTDVCVNKGIPYRGRIFNYDQFECSPKFVEYGGVSLIKQMNDYCDSKVEYDPETGKLIALGINYDEDNFDNVLTVLTERYGKAIDKSSKNFTDPKLNVGFEWKDSKGGYVMLGMSSVTQVQEGRISPIVMRYCTTLTIGTKAMTNLRNAMEKKSEAVYKNKIKSNASKL